VSIYDGCDPWQIAYDFGNRKRLMRTFMVDASGICTEPESYVLLPDRAKMMRGRDANRRQIERFKRARNGKRRRIDPYGIAERDGWMCHLCGGNIDRALHSQGWLNPDGASVDHVIPLSKGGSNDPANLKAAHLSCNVRRGNRPVSR
jgi:hypothetical protein